MERVVNQCAAHLVNDLSNDTCIETRALPGINRNKNFVSKVDQYIADHVSVCFCATHLAGYLQEPIFIFLPQFPELSETTGFLQLPSIQIEVLHQTKQEMAMVAEDSLSRLVLDWIRRDLTENSGSVT